MVRKTALCRVWLGNRKNPQPFLGLLAVMVAIEYDRFRYRDRNNMGLRHEKLDVYRLSMKQKVNNEKRNWTVLSLGSVNQ